MTAEELLARATGRDDPVYITPGEEQAVRALRDFRSYIDPRTQLIIERSTREGWVCRDQRRIGLFQNHEVRVRRFAASPGDEDAWIAEGSDKTFEEWVSAQRGG